jgi:hypothetical protein
MEALSDAGPQGVRDKPLSNLFLSFLILSIPFFSSATATAIPVFLDLLLLAEPFRPNRATVVSKTLVTIVILKPQ